MKKKLSKSVSVLITSIIVLFLLPGDSLRLLSMYLRHYGLSENIIRYFSRMPASELFLMLISIFFIVLIIISIIKILILSYKLAPTAAQAAPQGLRQRSLQSRLPYPPQDMLPRRL